MPSTHIQEIRLREAPWVTPSSLPLNPGLVAIVGSRGSGKTALLDIVAAASGALDLELGDSSFLGRASSPVDLLEEAAVDLMWGDSSESSAALSEAVEAERPDVGAVCYLSQQFVERLCSSAGLATELRREMERVVFESTEQTDRLEADSFDSLADALLEPIRSRRNELRTGIHHVAERIAAEEALRDQLPALRKEKDELTRQIAAARKEQEALLPKGKEERARRLLELEAACTTVEARVEALRRRRKLIDDLSAEVEHTRRSREPDWHSRLRERFSDAPLTPDDWAFFRLVFAGDVDAVLQRHAATLDRQIDAATRGVPSTPEDRANVPLGEWPLLPLRERRDDAKKEVGIDAQQQAKYDLLQRRLTHQEASVRKLNLDLEHASGAAARRRALVESRRRDYVQVFQTLVEEEGVLARLYSFLESTLATATGALAKLKFIVKRSVDVLAWVTKGEGLLDLRRDSRFRGHGALLEEASRRLLPAWQSGTAEEVASAMDAFREEFREDLLSARPASIKPEGLRAWAQQIADWLHDSTHVAIQYGIIHDGVAIEQLSPGTRGIVLLLLYLAIDRYDRRPLLVDQPEENLDPNSVFEELVPHFRDARKRRQVIVVTHNANLVVNTDADQVIVSTATQKETGGLPGLHYRSGSLENSEIRRSVCELLEGGERAFLERERRYRLRWDEPR